MARGRDNTIQASRRQSQRRTDQGARAPSEARLHPPYQHRQARSLTTQLRRAARRRLLRPRQRPGRKRPMHPRRAALGAAAALLAAPALAQAPFPDRPLRLVVSYPPGGVTDIVGRIVAEPLGQRLGQPVIVENRAGAGGNIGAQAASAADPDGYPLLIGTAAMYGVNPLLYAKSGVDLQRDFLPLGTINDMANVLSVNPKRLDVGSVAELVARGKKGGLIYASVGNGSSSHLCATLLQRMAGFEATHVPYRGSSPAVAPLLAAGGGLLFRPPPASPQPHP